MKYVKVALGVVLFYSLAQSYEFRFYCYDGYTVGAPACTCIHVYTTNEFDEMTITWNNRPPLINYLADFRSGSWGLWYTFSSPALDAYVNNCVSNNDPIPFGTRCSLWLWPGSIVWYYHSKETNASLKPVLVPMPSGYTLTDDARVDEDHPNTNYGTDYLWNCDNNNPMRQISYFMFSLPTSVEESERSTIIFRVIPNLFYNSTSISYSVLPRESGKRVVLSIYDVSGKLVKNLADGVESPGEHKILWSGDDEKGNGVPAGIYFLRLTIGDRISTGKLIKQ